MIQCKTCGHIHDEDLCPQCAGTAVSVADDSLDSMIQGASVPSLSTLFKRAKEAGVIGPVSVYGEGAGTNASN